MQVDEMTVIADKGYYPVSRFEKCAKENIKPIESCANQAHHVENDEYEKSEFVFDVERNG